jgi:hypothetical protein
LKEKCGEYVPLQGEELAAIIKRGLEAGFRILDVFGQDSFDDVPLLHTIAEACKDDCLAFGISTNTLYLLNHYDHSLEIWDELKEKLGNPEHFTVRLSWGPDMMQKALGLPRFNGDEEKLCGAMAEVIYNFKNTDRFPERIPGKSNRLIFRWFEAMSRSQDKVSYRLARNNFEEFRDDLLSALDQRTAQDGKRWENREIFDELEFGAMDFPTFEAVRYGIRKGYLCREWTVKKLFEKRDIWQQRECMYIPVIDVCGFISGCLSRREGYIEKVSPENFFDVVLKPFSRPRMRSLYYDRDPERISRKAAKGRQFGFAIALRPGGDFAGQKQFHFEEAESLMFFDKELMLKIDLLFLLDHILRKQEGFIIESIPDRLLAPLLSRELSAAFLAYYSAYETAPQCLIDRGVMDQLKVHQKEGVHALFDVLKYELMRMAEEGRIRSSMNTDALRRYLQELQPSEFAFQPGQPAERISLLPTLGNTSFSKRMFRRSLFSGDRFRREEALRAMALMSEEKTVGLAKVEDIVLEALPLNLFSRKEQRSIIRMLEERLFLFQPKTESLVIVTQFNFFSEVEEAPDWSPLVKYLSRDEVMIFIRILSTLSFYSEYEDARALAFNYWTKLAVLCVDRTKKTDSSLDYEPLRDVLKDSLERKESLFSLRGVSLSARIDSLLLWTNFGLTDDEYSLREVKKFLLDEEVNREAVNILTFTDMGLMLWRRFCGNIRPEEFSFRLLEEIETMIINDEIGIFSRSSETAVFGGMDEIMENMILCSGLCRMKTEPMSIRFMKEIPSSILGQEKIINALSASPNTASWLLPHCQFPEAGILLAMIEKYGKTEPESVYRCYTEKIGNVNSMREKEGRVKEYPASDGGAVEECARRIGAVISRDNSEGLSAQSAPQNEIGVLSGALFGLYPESKTGPPLSSVFALPVGTAVSLFPSSRINNPHIIYYLLYHSLSVDAFIERDGGAENCIIVFDVSNKVMVRLEVVKAVDPAKEGQSRSSVGEWMKWRPKQRIIHLSDILEYALRGRLNNNELYMAVSDEGRVEGILYMLYKKTPLDAGIAFVEIAPWNREGVDRRYRGVGAELRAFGIRGLLSRDPGLSPLTCILAEMLGHRSAKSNIFPRLKR